MTKPFIIERSFPAPRERVWQAWTERERLGKLDIKKLKQAAKGK